MILSLTRIDGTKAQYVVPTLAEAHAYSKATQGTSYDKVERKNISGGLPMVWARVQ